MQYIGAGKKTLHSDENPKIVSAVFTVDKNRKYSFDVNQTIKISALKRMIIAAADVGKNLKIFHEGEEYTHQDENLLTLFPDLDVIKFDLQLEYNSIEEYDPLLKIKLNQKYCPQHDAKYQYFYCHTCKRSICSQCVISNNHEEHEIKEKYDYLQSSKQLVEKLFKNWQLNLDSWSTERINSLKEKINVTFFPVLIQMIKTIEGKLISLISNFLRGEKDNFLKIQENVTSLKENCAEGLDKLKDEIEIEDMMWDEEIYLTFDRKFEDIANEKNKIKDDVEKFAVYKEQFDLITKTVDKIYNDIYIFWDKYLNDSIYKEIQDKIKEPAIDSINKKEIFYRIWSDIKRYPAAKKVEFSNIEVTQIQPVKNESDFVIDIERQEDSIKNQNAKNNDELILCHPWEDTNQIKIFTFSKDSFETKGIPENNSFFNVFPKDCAWYSFNNNWYITGGKHKNQMLVSTARFIKYCPESNSFTSLPDMPEPRFGHSMCIDNMNNIYVVGGNSRTILKFDFITNKWSKLRIMLSTERYHATTFISEDWSLFVFYGIDMNGKYVTSIEKAEINGKGQCVIVNTNKKIKLADCGVISLNPKDKNIYWIGGKNEKGHMIKSSLKFNMDTNQLSVMAFTLISGASFKQNLLPKLKNGMYGGFVWIRVVRLRNCFLNRKENVSGYR